jgi:hypothetical protein
MHTTLRRGLTAAALLPALCGNAAFAGTTTLTFARTALTNVTDSAGLTQYEAGTVSKAGGSAIGTYNISRRVTTGFSGSLNTAATTITMVLAASASAPLNNITVEGSHSFNSGAFLGSVSAASSKYHFTVGAAAVGTIGSSETLKLTWTGATPFP